MNPFHSDLCPDMFIHGHTLQLLSPKLPNFAISHPAWSKIYFFSPIGHWRFADFEGPISPFFFVDTVFYMENHLFFSENGKSQFQWMSFLCASWGSRHHRSPVPRDDFLNGAMVER